MLKAAGLALAVALAACGGSNTEYSYPEKNIGGSYDQNATNKKREGLFGPGGLNIFGGGGTKEDPGATGGIGVNSFLWRASLDSITFMPLASADPFGGVIITDWYAPPETPNERFKLNIYILGRQLRADGVKAAIFRQRRDPSGAWTDAAVEARTAIDLENVILTRARQLRLDSERP
jgi:hypothetical protein